MQTQLDCIPCYLRQTLEAARRVTSDGALQGQVFQEILAMCSNMDMTKSPPEVGQLIHRRLRELTGVNDPYWEAKRHFNALALKAVERLRPLVMEAEDPLFAAAHLSVAANAIDMGVASAITDRQVQETLSSLPSQSAVGDWQAFLRALESGGRILYLADNAGELAVDRLVIELLGPERVTLAVRGAPILNDVLMEDVQEVGLDRIVSVIDNGSDAPGTLLSDCSPEFMEHFQSADLIISKGQGNYETLCNGPDNIAFWFKVKCEVVAGQTGMPLNSFLLLPPRNIL